MQRGRNPITCDNLDYSQTFLTQNTSQIHIKSTSSTGCSGPAQTTSVISKKHLKEAESVQEKSLKQTRVWTISHALVSSSFLCT